MSEMTEDALLEVLRAALEPGEGEDATGARTVRELAVALGCSEPQMRSRLKALKRTGQLVVVRVVRERLDGVLQRVPAYRYQEKNQ